MFLTPLAAVWKTPSVTMMKKKCSMLIIKIAMPMEQSKIVLLPVDAEYSLCFYTPNGLYQCLARVVERYKSNNLFVLSMELETDLQKYQRREYYRLNTILDMKSKEINDDEKELVTYKPEELRFKKSRGHRNELTDEEKKALKELES